MEESEKLLYVVGAKTDKIFFPFFLLNDLHPKDVQ